MMKLHVDYGRCNFLIFSMWKFSCVVSLAERQRVLSNANVQRGEWANGPTAICN